MEREYIVAHADKSVLKISGLEVKGLNTVELERILADKLKTNVRVIGVTGDGIEMDVYDIEPEQVRKNEKGLIDCIALAEGIRVTDVTKMVCNEKIVEVEFSQIPDTPISECPREKWIKRS